MFFASIIASATGVLAQEAAAKPVEDPAFAKLSMGLSTKTGNTESDSYSGRLEAGNTYNKTLVSFLAEGGYAESESVDADGKSQSNQTEGTAKVNGNVKQRFDGFYLFADETLFHDSIADIKLRSITSSGVGTFLADTDDFKFTVEVGGAYVYEDVKDVEDDYFALRFAERMDYKVNETVGMWEKLEVIPEASDFGNLLLSFEAGIDSKVTKNASFGVIFKVEHDAEPAEGVEETDTTLIAQVSYSL